VKVVNSNLKEINFIKNAFLLPERNMFFSLLLQSYEKETEIMILLQKNFSN